MKKGGGSAKGSNFEREICKSLGLWWTHDERDDVFWRTAGSGGRATNRAKRGAQTAGAYGDLTYTDAIGKPLLDLCCFEIKRGYGAWCVLDLVDKRPGAKPCKAEEFWLQAQTSAEQAGVRFPVVIFRRDNKQTGIMFGKDFLNAVAPVLGPHRGNKLLTIMGSGTVVVMLFSEFLEYFTPEAIQGLL